MARSLARLRYFLREESLSLWLIVFSLALNVIAWLIPQGNLRQPARDPLGFIQFVSDRVSDALLLQYFWSALLAVTVFTLGYAAYRIATLSFKTLVDRVDL